MNRWILILMALLTGLSSVSAEAIAAPQHQQVPAGDTRTTVSVQAETPTFRMGKPSHTYRDNPVTGIPTKLTENTVGYLGTADLSYPKVGDLYYGVVQIANLSGVSTAVVADIQLPRNTAFDIIANDPDKRVGCFLRNFHTGQSTELMGADCDQTPSPGTYGGAHFEPSSSNNPGVWELPAGHTLQIMVPLSSQTALNGEATGDCLIGLVAAAGARGDGWDRPGPTDTCPLPEGHGASRGVFVAPGTPPPPTVTSGPSSVDNGAQTPSNNDKNKKKKGKKGKGKK